MMDDEKEDISKELKEKIDEAIIDNTLGTIKEIETLIEMNSKDVDNTSEK